MRIIVCENCGEDEDLTGRPSSGTVEITCNRCGHVWLRDTEPRCKKCGGHDVRALEDPLIQRARGTAYSVVGTRTIYLCEKCDAAEIKARVPSPEEGPPREDPWK